MTGSRWTTSSLGDQTTCFNNGFQSGHTTGWHDGYMFGLWVSPTFVDGYNLAWAEGYGYYTPRGFREGQNSVWLSRFWDGYWYCSPLAYQDAYDAYVGPAFVQGQNSIWAARFWDGYWNCSPLAYADAYDAYVGPAFQQGKNAVWQLRYDAGVNSADAYNLYTPPAFTQGQNAAFLPRWQQGFTDAYGTWHSLGFTEGQNAAFLPRWQQGFADAYGTWVPLGFQEGVNATWQPQFDAGVNSQDAYNLYTPPAFTQGQNAAFLPRWQQGFTDAYGTWHSLGFTEGQNAAFLPRWQQGFADAYGTWVPLGFQEGVNATWQPQFDAGVNSADAYNLYTPPAFTQGQNSNFLSRWTQGFTDAYGTWVPLGFAEGERAAFLPRWKQGYADAYDSYYYQGLTDGYSRDGYYGRNYGNDGYYFLGLGRGGGGDAYGIYVPAAFQQGKNAAFLPRWLEGYQDAYGPVNGVPPDGYYWMGRNDGKILDGYGFWQTVFFNEGHNAGVNDAYGIWTPVAFQQGQNAAFLPRWTQGFNDAYGTWVPQGFAEGQRASFLPRYTIGVNSQDAYNLWTPPAFQMGHNDGVNDAYSIWTPPAFSMGYNHGYVDAYGHFTLPSRVTWKPQGFTDTGESFILPFNDPGVHNRTTSMTVNAIAVTPSARYSACGYPCVRTATTWRPDNDSYGGNLTVAGSGTAPTPWQYSPLFGAWDGSMLYNTAKYHACDDTTTGQITTGDPHWELVFKTPAAAPGANIVISAKRNAGVGWEIGIDTSLRLYVTIQDAGGSTTMVSAALAAAAWHQADIFIHRDENSTSGGQIYICGKASGSGVNFSSRNGSLTNSVAMTIGADGGGNYPYSSEVAFVAVRSYVSWFQAGAAGPTEWATVAEERHLRTCGFWPSYAEGTYRPQAWGRSGTSWLTRCDSNKFQRLFLVGQDWMVVEQFYIREDGYMGTGASIENSNTNRITYSQAFDNAAWTKTRSTIVGDQFTAPDGTLTADLLREDGTATSTHLVQSAAFSYSNTYVYVGSVFVRADACSNFQLVMYVTATASAYFNVATGSVSNLSAGCDVAGMEYWGNGWWRCFVAGRATGTNTNGYLQVVTALGPGQNSYTGRYANALFLWQAQVDAVSERSTPGSIIPTTSAAASRVADTVMYWIGNDGNLGSVGNLAGTIQYDSIVTPRTGTYYKFDWQPLTLGDGTYNNRVELRITLRNGGGGATYGAPYTYLAAAGVGTERSPYLIGDLQDGRRNRSRTDYQLNNTRYVINGFPQPAITTAQVIPSLTGRARIYVSADGSGTRYDEGSVLVSLIKCWPTYQS